MARNAFVVVMEIASWEHVLVKPVSYQAVAQPKFGDFERRPLIVKQPMH